VLFSCAPAGKKGKKGKPPEERGKGGDGRIPSFHQAGKGERDNSLAFKRKKKRAREGMKVAAAGCLPLPLVPEEKKRT